MCRIKYKLYFFIFLFSSIGAVAANAADPEAAQHKKYAHQGKRFPPVFFVTNVDNQDFKKHLESYEAFSRIDDEAIGLPIGVRVLNGLRQKMDGTGFTSALIAASTLGIIPIVSNKAFKVRYDVFVQGDIVTTYEYEMTSTDVQSAWNGPLTKRDLKPEEEKFLELSMDKFLFEVKASESLQALFDEYDYYFGEQ